MVQFINMLRFDRAQLSEIVDCRRCLTLFDFSEVTEDVSFAELVEFPRVAFFGSTGSQFFRIMPTFAAQRR